MKVLFRADASSAIGSGHVMRCVTLANCLKARFQAQVTFACRELPGDFIAWLEQAGFSVIHWQSDDATYLPALEPFDWLIVDHYGLDASWETPMRAYAERILVIDDLADRPHDCDILLDQNYFTQSEQRYSQRVPQGCLQLLGPRFALLRPDFQQARVDAFPQGRPPKSRIETIQVFFGGSDPTGETLRALHALETLNPLTLQIDVIVGASNPKNLQVKAFCDAQPNFHFYCQTNQMAPLMAKADLAIGAGGTATWERLCVGLPALVISVAQNQEQISREVAEAGAQIYLGRSGEVGEIQLKEMLERCLIELDALRAISRNAMALVDGHGANRVADRMNQLVL